MSRQIALGEVATIIMGQSPDSHLCNDEEKGIAFLQGCAEFGDKFPIPKNYCIAPKKLSPKDSILISVRAPVGDLNLADREYVIGRGLAGIVPIKTSRNFLYYSIQQYKNQLERVSQGSTFAAINSADLYNFLINIYPLPHQRKIARILTTVDNIIEKTEAAIAKYKAIKQGMMHDLFTRGIDVKTGKLRPKFEDAPQLYKETPLGWIPKDWAVKRLDELTKDGLRNGYFKKPEYVGWGYKLINVSDLYQPYEIDINQKDVQRVFATPNDYSKYEVQVGDLFFTRSSLVLEGIAHCNIVLKLPEPSVWECHVVRLRPDKQKINPEFLGFYCRTYEARLFLMSIAKQVTMTTISQPDIAKLPVCVPTNINEQKEIAKRLRSIDRIIQKEEISKLKHQKLKSGLMQDLLTGRKEVTPDPEDFQEIEN
ncbi:MAG: type restriction enzyme subunit [Clostridiales bacterium]|nr:type restriction enzyme subunit [Clostridiales bacterium]MDN5283077.1 type restriction enzyme subunit [Candidatus Ozemobacter sp.]